MTAAGALTLVRASILASLFACLLIPVRPAWADFTVPPNRPGDFAPRDECSRLGGAGTFLADLRGAIARRDADALVHLADAEVVLDFGGGSGHVELRRRLSGAEGAGLWRELQSLSSLGCDEVSGELVLPWLFAQDLGDVDPYDALLAAGPSVPLYTRAGARGRRAGSLNWQLVVGVADPPAPLGFRRVSVINARREGLVRSSQLRSVIGYRLVAAMQGGQWRITAVVAGD